MVFPNSNLPSGAQPWVRDVQKRVEVLEKNVKANEINSTSRDIQMEANFKRLDANVTGLIAADANIVIAIDKANEGIALANEASGEALLASSQAIGAANDAAAAASTANSAAAAASAAATAAQNAANTANSAIAILQSLTTTSYYGLASTSWSYTNTFYDIPINYYGSTAIDIPEAGGQRRVIVTAVFDVDMRSTNTAAAVGAVQQATARIYGSTSSSSNSAFNGSAVFGSSTITMRNYGGTSLTVMGDYLVTSSSTLSWNPDLVIESGTNGTFTGAANLRSVSVIITKV